MKYLQAKGNTTKRLFQQTIQPKRWQTMTTRAYTDTKDKLFGQDAIGKSTIRSVQDMIRNRETTCEEIVEAYLDRMKYMEPKINSFMGDEVAEKAAEEALRSSAALDERLSSMSSINEMERHLPLAGVPIAVKDNICTEGLVTTAGSKALKNYVPAGDATIVQRLKDKGALVLGKTMCDEFGMGSTTESCTVVASSSSPTTCNPWDLGRVPGGSSGGSAAAVAARQCAVALGTDTGGSIRQPASFCGVVGLKPTYGRVSRFGVIAYGSSLDCPGPIASTVEDCAILLDAIAGPDHLDASSANTPLTDKNEYHTYIKMAQGRLNGGTELPLSTMKIGVISQTMADDGRLDSRVRDVMVEAIDTLKSLGAQVEDVDVPMFDLGLPAYYITAVAEASSNLSRYDGMRYGNRTASSASANLMKAITENRGEGLGDEPLRRILMGTYTLSQGYGDALYKKAQVVRKRVQREMLDRLKDYDILVTPTAPAPAYSMNEALLDPLQMYLGDIMTVNVNLAGFPAISLPAGLVPSDVEDPQSGKLPVGIQFIAGPFNESALLMAGECFEKTVGIVSCTPNVNY